MNRALSILCLTLLLSGCARDHVQSVLHPASANSAEIERLWWFMFAVCALVFAAVIGLMLLAVFLKPCERRDASARGATTFVVISGIVIPGIILTGFLFYSLGVTVTSKAGPESLTVRVVGFRWWWHVEYPEHQITTANEIYIPAGETVRLEVQSADVIHSLWIPNLHGKMDLLPEHPNSFWIRADRPGTWRGQCAEFCGLQHARMALMVSALPKAEFDNWVSERQSAATRPVSNEHRRGRQVFFNRGCNVCHAIRGTDADGKLAPDLTHVGSRLTLGGATLTNNTGNLMGWIANPQALKPGNLMPATYMHPDELHALVDYLQSLK